MNFHFIINSSRFCMLVLGMAIYLVMAPNLLAGSIIEADPGNYRSLIGSLQAGDTLQLAAGTYDTGLPVSNLHGNSTDPITITGPENGEPAVFVGRSCCNTVQLNNASHVVIRHLKLDGLGIPYVDAVNSRGVTHHIMIEDLLIVNHGGAYQPDTDHQATVGIATRGPAWDWVIRNNIIIGAGTGMYLGNSNGAEPFVRGLIEHNVIMDTLGYNIEIKHQVPRPTGVGLPTEDSKTIIRHNVFSKANNSSRSGTWARPNFLVGHWPLSGPGSNDLYEIYGNFFYENPSEVLFQGEGNIALYDNIFVNSSRGAVGIQQHNDRPRTIRVFNNTVIASGVGIRVAGVNTLYDQLVAGNAVFAANPITVDSQVDQRDNVTDSYSLSANYLANPTGSLGSLDLYPVSGMLSGTAIDTIVLQQFTDWDVDFNGRQRDGTFRGAYAGEGQNPGWILSLENKPSTTTQVQAPIITSQPSPQTVVEGQTATFSVAATGGSLAYQWRGNGTTIAGATSASYTTPVLSLDDNDASYDCVISNAQGSVTSNGVVLSVTGGTIAPTIRAVSATSATTMTVVFSEAVTEATAELGANYSIDNNVSVLSAALDADTQRVQLTVSELTEAVNYTLTVSGIQDRSPSANTIDPFSSQTFSYTSGNASPAAGGGGGALGSWLALALLPMAYRRRRALGREQEAKRHLGSSC